MGATPDAPKWPRDAGGVTLGADSHLDSTSPAGGEHGRGTLFELVPRTGELRVRYHFDRTLHGGGPVGGLSSGSGHWLCGTTYEGGQMPPRKADRASS